MSIQTHFNTFHDAIKLGKQDDAYKKARERDTSITKAIRESFVNAGHPVIEDFIQGSFSTDTAILNKSADFDIDRAIVINHEDAPENPTSPKITICDDVLEKRGFKNTKIKKPCVTADYISENLHLDFPVYRVLNGQYELAVGKRNSGDANRKWDSSNPKGLRDWINDKSGYYGSPADKLKQFKRNVRYLKRWRDENFTDIVAKKVYSIGLTVMAKQCFSPCFDDDGKPNDLTALSNTVSLMLDYGYFNYQRNDQYKVAVNLPVIPGRDIFDGSNLDTGTQLRNKLSTMKDKLNDAIIEKNEFKQCKILNLLFGEDFPIPDQNKSSVTTKKAVFSSAGAVGTSQGA